MKRIAFDTRFKQIWPIRTGSAMKTLLPRAQRAFSCLPMTSSSLMCFVRHSVAKVAMLSGAERQQVSLDD